MKAIKLRTKIEAAMAIIFVIILAVAGVASVTRIISDSSDNSYTFIRNSNGNYWEPIGSNVQLAIDDVASTGGGTVWVGSDISIGSPIVPKNNVMINFCRNTVTLTNDVAFIELVGDGSTGLRHSIVENAMVQLTNTHTVGVIHVYIPSGATSVPYTIRHNVVRDIHMSKGYGVSHEYSAIHLDIQGDSSILDNRFENIWSDYAGTGIKLECGSSGWANGNIFDNIYINYYETFIDFVFTVPRAGGNGFNYNTFYDCRCQTVSSDSLSYWSQYGVKNVSGYGNEFRSCLVWDWYMVDDDHSSHGIHDWWIGSGAYDTIIDAMSVDYDYYRDDGTRTVLNTRGLTHPTIYQQSTEPDIPDDSVAYWVDTDDGKYYLILDSGGIQKKEELT